MGEAAGVAVDTNGHVMVFHRPGRGFDTAATELLKDPAVLEIDPQSGRLIRFVGREHVPRAARHHDRLRRTTCSSPTSRCSRSSSSRTTASCCSASASRASASGTRRISISRPTSRFAPTARSTCRTATSTAASRSSTATASGSREWGKKGAGHGEFSNPHGLAFVTGNTDVIVADRENSRLQLFDRNGAFKREWTGAKDAATTGRVFSVATDADGLALCRHPPRRLRHRAHRRAEARSRLEDRRGRRLRPARRSGLQRRARPGRGTRRLDLRRRNPHQTRRQAASASPAGSRILASVTWPWLRALPAPPCSRWP